eukprot:2601-Heterococcus_DN1.PRE.2
MSWQRAATSVDSIVTISACDQSARQRKHVVHSRMSSESEWSTKQAYTRKHLVKLFTHRVLLQYGVSTVLKEMCKMRKQTKFANAGITLEKAAALQHIATLSHQSLQ